MMHGQQNVKNKKKMSRKIWQGIVSGLFRISPGKTRESRCNGKGDSFSRHGANIRVKLMTPESSVKGTRWTR